MSADEQRKEMEGNKKTLKLKSKVQNQVKSKIKMENKFLENPKSEILNPKQNPKSQIPNSKRHNNK